jgi:hypothetical protein
MTRSREDGMGASYFDMEEVALLIEWTRISNAIVDWQLFYFWDVSHVQPKCHR